MMNRIKIKTKAREEMVNITSDIERSIPDNFSGVCIVFVQHTTCGMTVNENADPDVQTDMLGFLRRLIPQSPTTPSAATEVGTATPPLAGGEPFFKHAEGNSDAHIKSSLVGTSVTVPFEDGRLALGRWQGIYLCEFDGPRERKVVVQCLVADS
jgi:thiamine phosphate synthase YjbQ (UPF0047 family)